MLHSQIFGDTGVMSDKSALFEDMRNFGIIDRKREDNCCINTLKWKMLLEIATGRARWRKVEDRWCMQSVKSVVYSRKHKEQ